MPWSPEARLHIMLLDDADPRHPGWKECDNFPECDEMVLTGDTQCDRCLGEIDPPPNEEDR